MAIISDDQFSVDLPEELLFEILFRLPVKSLVKFMVVCKTWLALIKSHRFISMHLKHSLKTKPNSSRLVLDQKHIGEKYTMLLGSEGEDYQVNAHFPFLDQGNCIKIIGLSYGLVCLISWALDACEFTEIFVFNLSTRRFCRIMEENHVHTKEIGLGFTCDPYSGDYSVIKLNFILGSTTADRKLGQAWIYTLGASCWRKIDIRTPIGAGYLMLYDPSAVVIGSKFYWSCLGLSGRVFLSFNMRDKSFGVISDPRDFDTTGKSHHQFRVSHPREKFALAEMTGKGVCTVWTLDKDSITWSIKFSFDLMPLIATKVEIKDDDSLSMRIDLSRRDDLLVVSVVFVQPDGRVRDHKRFLYDIISREITLLPLCELGFHYRVFGYTESLLPVMKDGQV